MTQVSFAFPTEEIAAALHAKVEETLTNLRAITAGPAMVHRIALHASIATRASPLAKQWADLKPVKDLEGADLIDWFYKLAQVVGKDELKAVRRAHNAQVAAQVLRDPLADDFRRVLEDLFGGPDPMVDSAIAAVLKILRDRWNAASRERREFHKKVRHGDNATQGTHGFLAGVGTRGTHFHGDPRVKHGLETVIGSIIGRTVEASTEHTRIEGMTVQQAIMDHYSKQTGQDGLQFRFTCADASAWVEEAGYSPNADSPALSYLVAAGYIERVEKGVYRFLEPVLPADIPVCSRKPVTETPHHTR